MAKKWWESSPVVGDEGKDDWYKSSPEVDSTGKPIGEAHDGDTFRLADGRNARLYGYDAFELDQQGRAPDGSMIPLGRNSRSALLPYLPGATATTAGKPSYGRPVMSLEQGGDDPVIPLLQGGNGLAAPEYLGGDSPLLRPYMEAERFARQNRRGAFSTTFATPKADRQGEGEPWTGPKDGAREAVFFDDPTPMQGMRPEDARELERLWVDRSVTADQLNAFVASKGYKLDAKALKNRANPNYRLGGETQYSGPPPRLLTDVGDGRLGATLRGYADPINMLDEMGAVADTFTGVGGRESIWNSDRRFGDILHNNLEQNRSILANDDANYPWWRFGGQMASGLIAPGASVEGVGLNAARSVLRAGGTRFAATKAAEAAVRGRLATVGAIEGGLAGAGQGETTGQRLAGAAIGSTAGGVLGVATGYGLPAAGRYVSSRFRRGLADAEPDPAAHQFVNGVTDTAQADAEDYALGAAPTLNGDAPAMPADTAAGRAGERPRQVSATMPAVDENDRLGPRSVLDFVPAKGEPGVSVIDEEGLATAVYRDAEGRARGAVQIPVTPEAREIFETVSAYVDPALRRQGVASKLYDALRKAGHPIDELSGTGDLTPDGAAFVNKRRAAMDAEIDQPTIYGPDLEPTGEVRRILDDAPDAERRAAADRLSSSDVLPLPANTVDGIDEAMRIDAGRIAAVRAPDERKVLESRTIPSPIDGSRTMPKRGPLDLVTWLRTQGGIKAQGGELEHAGIDNAPRKGLDFAGGEGRFGKLVSNEGMTYDEAALRAWEAGYFPDHADRPTPAEFLDALTQTHNGNARHFRAEDHGEIDDFLVQREARLAVEAAEAEGAPLSVDRGQPVDMADLDANSAPVSAYEEWGENAPNFAGNINLANLDSPQAIKRALTVTDRAAGGFDAARRGRITHAETERLAAELGMTADQLLKRRKGEAFNAEQALAARQILARSATDLVNMAKRISRYERPGDELEHQFREAWLRHVAIQEQVSGMTAEAGRLLQQFRQTADAAALGRVLPSLANLPGGASRIKDAADMIVDLERVGSGPEEINRFALKSLKARTGDQLMEYYVNSLLSGPQTHAVNMLSNTITAVAQLPEHGAAAVLGAVSRPIERGVARLFGKTAKDADRVAFSEVGARTVGLLQGTRDGLVAFAKVLRTGDSLDPVTKLEGQQFKAIPGKSGEIIRIPTRLLTAEDELFKGMARRMELTGLAMRRARAEGLKGSAAAKRAQELLAAPTDDMVEKAQDYARYLTFQAPLGGFMRHISAAANESRAFRFLVPFIRTPTNLLKFAIERSPAAPILKEWRKDVAAGGARRDLAIVRALVGSGVGAMIYEEAARGRITGGGPADENAKRVMLANGWQPYSFKVGDTYYSYRRLDPIATTIGTVADMVDLGSQMTDKQREKSTTLISAAIMNNLASKTWLSGISGLADALSDPDRNMQDFVSRSVSSVAVPAIVAQIARTTDPILREAREPLARIRSRVPGLSDDLMPRLDVFGQPVVSEGGVGPDILSPIWTGTNKRDPVAVALLSSGIGLTMPKRTSKTEALSDADFNRYQALAGQKTHGQLAEVIRTPEWKAADKGERGDMVDKIVKRAREEARDEILQPAGANWWEVGEVVQ